MANQLVSKGRNIMEGNDFIISKMIKWGIFISVFIAISLYAKYAKKNKKEDEFAMTDEEIKQGEYLADGGGELLTDEEEKQVWEEFQGKVEEDKDGTS